jgi:hypothetical protein
MPVLPLIDMAMLRVGRPALITPRMGINIDGRKGRIKAIYRTGNYPITVAYPAIKRRESIGFCEGILKPRIAANRWNQRFIGGVPGNILRAMTASGEQVIEIVADESPARTSGRGTITDRPLPRCWGRS